MASADDYDWVEDVLSDAACVTVVTGRSVADVLSAFGADPAVEVDVEDAYEDDMVSVVESGGAVLAVEFNGFQGSMPEVLARVTAGGGMAASMFWNVNDDNAFTCARDGELVVTVDLYDAEDAEDANDAGAAGEVELPEQVRALFASAADEEADLHATGLAMVEAYVGVPVPRAAVEAISVAHPITAPVA